MDTGSAAGSGTNIKIKIKTMEPASYELEVPLEVSKGDLPRPAFLQTIA